MAQLLLIKTANTTAKKIGDIVGVYRPEHKFSSHELEIFDVLNIEGYEALELKKALSYPEIKTVYRMPVADEWSFDMPEEKEVWRPVDSDKWKYYESSTKYKLNISVLTVREKEDLGKDSAEVSKPVKQTILDKIEERISDDETNLVECTELNRSVIEIG